MTPDTNSRSPSSVSSGVHFPPHRLHIDAPIAARKNPAPTTMPSTTAVA
jgi:hypothetical protein